MILDFTAGQWLTVHSLVMATALLVYVITSHVMQHRRHPSAAIAWILFIVLVPYVALPVFLIFGSRKLSRPVPGRQPRLDATRRVRGWAEETIAALGQPAPVACHDLTVHRDGKEAQQSLFATLASAKHSIALCTFILGRDPLGDSVIDCLCEKAREGVRVRVLLDGLGSLMAGRPNLRRLVVAGGEFELFVPPLHSPLRGRTNLRDHRKLLIVDFPEGDARLWSGGRNLASEYFEGKGGEPPWRDLSFDLRGALVRQASALFERDWAFANGRTVLAQTAPAEADAADGEEGACAQLVASGPDQPDDAIHALLVTGAYRASRRIALATPYFFPDSALSMALCMAARRGVRVDLLVPARTNHPLSDFARNRALRAVEHAGAHVWLAPGMQHGKLALFDDTLALAGSANLDIRSLFLNYELMFAFHAAADVQGFADWFAQECSSARRYAGQRPGLVRDVAEGLLLWLGFQL